MQPKNRRLNRNIKINTKMLQQYGMQLVCFIYCPFKRGQDELVGEVPTIFNFTFISLIS